MSYHILITMEELQALKATVGPGDDTTLSRFVERVEDLFEEQGSDECEALRAAAMEHVEEGTWEVDDNAIVSLGADKGAYVAAWRWVSNDEADLPIADVQEDPAYPVEDWREEFNGYDTDLEYSDWVDMKKAEETEGLDKPAKELEN